LITPNCLTPKFPLKICDQCRLSENLASALAREIFGLGFEADRFERSNRRAEKF
jgi:hypothetical protein